MPDSLGITELIAGYRDGLRSGEILIPRCVNCGRWNWYPRGVCDGCGSVERRLEAVRAAGTVHSWTRVQRAVPPAQDIATPYVVAIVELSDARGVRIPCRSTPPDADPVIGQQVRLQFSSADPPYLFFDASA